MWNRKSIFLSIFLNYFFVILFVLCVSMILSFNILKKQIFNSYQKQLLSIAYTIQPFIAKDIQNYQVLDISKENIYKTAKKLNYRVTLIDRNGKVFFDTENDWTKMELHNNRLEIMAAYDGSVGVEERYSSTEKKNMLYVAIPVFDGSNVKFVVRVSNFIDDRQTFIKYFRSIFLGILFGFILFGIFFAIISARKYSKPIKSLSNSVSDFATGKGAIKNRVFIDSYKEIENLASNFNAMADKIYFLIKDLTIEKQKINDIVNSVNVGILVIDKMDNVVFYNKIFDEILENNKERDYRNIDYREYLREHILINIITTAKKNMQTVIQEICYKDKFFICNIKNVEIDGSLIIVLHDVSQIKKLEQIKKDFVANVSHELRTPLASIKGFLETMQDDKEYNEEFVEIIMHNTDRIIKIVNDLISLSKLENIDNNSIELESISKSQIEEIILNIRKIFEQEIEQKGLNFNFMIDLDEIKFDKSMFYTLLINLISNAVRYTDNGKIDIKFWQDASADSAIRKKYISVEDTGIGIDGKYLDRIFERFFVIDKARSKTSGGTGLGLSIVKHIILLHSYKINVSSSNFGTKFVVEL